MLEIYWGVVGGDPHPWGVVVFVARITPDDHVICASTIRRPVGTTWESADTDVALEELWPRPPSEAAEFTAEAMGRLARPG